MRACRIVLKVNLRLASKWSQLATTITNQYKQTYPNHLGELPSLYQFGCSGSWHVEQNPHPPWDMFFQKLRQIAPLPIIDLGRFRMTILTVIFGFEIPSNPSPNDQCHKRWKFRMPCQIPVCNNGKFLTFPKNLQLPTYSIYSTVHNFPKHFKQKHDNYDVMRCLQQKTTQQILDNKKPPDSAFIRSPSAAPKFVAPADLPTSHA